MSSDSSDVSAADTVEDKFVINFKPAERVRHSLILLEGEIQTNRNNISSEKSTNEFKGEGNEQNSTSLASNVQNLSSSKQSEVLIHHKDSCTRWPLVERRFKAFVKLDKGVNVLKIQCHGLKVEQELRLCFEEQKDQERFVRVIYIKCSDSDGSFDAPDNVDNSLDSALPRLCFNALLLQTFMAVEMNRHGFGYQTFKLEENDDGEVLVHVFTSQLTTEKAHQMNGDELYRWFLSELESSSLNDPKCKFLAFMSCSHYDPPDEINPKDIPRYAKAHTALGGGQLGLFGTAGLHTWAENAGQLVKCFTDNRIIDKTKLFDDSAGRGTFWANYSTTLGAALHELGHCFDLMHMPEGIMGRGFDDMNHFVLMTSSTRHCLPSAESTEVTDAVPAAMKLFADHRAHWFRSSAVLLHHHKWLRVCPTAQPRPSLYVNWSCDVKGPVGNGHGGRGNQTYFDDVEWHKSKELTQSGYVVYHGDYINAVTPIASASSETGQGCPVYGKINDECSIHLFPLDENEYLTSLELRAGVWVDGIRFHSNLKSSIWFGGRGGDWYHLTPSPGENITGIFGTFGDFLGSLGIRLSKRKYTEESHSTLTPTVQSDVGIALVELRQEDDLINFWEFVQCDSPPLEFSLPPFWLETGSSPGKLSLMAVDIHGNIFRAGFIGYEDFMKPVESLRQKKTVLTIEESPKKT